VPTSCLLTHLSSTKKCIQSNGKEVSQCTKWPKIECASGGSHMQVAQNIRRGYGNKAKVNVLFQGAPNHACVSASNVSAAQGCPRPQWHRNGHARRGNVSGHAVALATPHVSGRCGVQVLPRRRCTVNDNSHGSSGACRRGGASAAYHSSSVAQTHAFRLPGPSPAGNSRSASVPN